MLMLEYVTIMLAVLAIVFSWFHFRPAYKNGRLARRDTWMPMPMLVLIGVLCVFVLGIRLLIVQETPRHGLDQTLKVL